MVVSYRSVAGYFTYFVYAWGLHKKKLLYSALYSCTVAVVRTCIVRRSGGLHPRAALGGDSLVPRRIMQIKRFDSADPRSGNVFGAKALHYLAIEGVWLSGLYVVCYRYKPSAVVLQTTAGRRVVQSASRFLRKCTPTWHGRLGQLSERANSGQGHGRTFGEWLLINKLLAPVNFPFKLWLAHLIVERKERIAAAARSASEGAAAKKEIG